jgi:hypothetical protein
MHVYICIRMYLRMCVWWHTCVLMHMHMCRPFDSQSNYCKSKHLILICVLFSIVLWHQHLWKHLSIINYLNATYIHTFIQHIHTAKSYWSRCCFNFKFKNWPITFVLGWMGIIHSISDRHSSKYNAWITITVVKQCYQQKYQRLGQIDIFSESCSFQPRTCL